MTVSEYDLMPGGSPRLVFFIYSVSCYQHVVHMQNGTDLLPCSQCRILDIEILCCSCPCSSGLLRSPCLYHSNLRFFKIIHSLQTHSSVLHVFSMQGDLSVHQAFPVTSLLHMPLPPLSVRGFLANDLSALSLTFLPFSTY